MSGTHHPFLSRVVRATRSSGSLRVTVPQVIASTLGLHAGEWVSWVVDPVSGQVRIERMERPGVGAPPTPSPVDRPGGANAEA